MKAIKDIKEIQKIALDILKFFDDFCREKHINYMLAYGTLLGAVRHKGFIPWDDDVDVMMTRKEYKKLMAAVQGFSHPYYKFFLPELTADYYAPLAKVVDTRTILKQEYGYSNVKNLGLYIDIFVIDGIPSNYSVAKKFYNTANRYRTLWSMSIRRLTAKSSSISNYLKRLPVSVFCKLFGFRFWRDKYIKYCQKHSDESGCMGVVLYGEGIKKEYFEPNMFETYSEVVFENKMFRAPADADKYLTQMYGDYMKLPPENQRKYHPNKAHWK